VRLAKCWDGPLGIGAQNRVSVRSIPGPERTAAYRGGFPLEVVGPFHRPVKHSQNDYHITLMDIRDHVRQTAWDQLTCSLHSPRPAQAWMLGKSLDAPNDLKHGIGRSVWVIAADMALNCFEIQASGGRPL
jgi:hypothetical protein